MGLLQSSSSFLGIDIGTTSVKIVELKKENNQARLVNYGFSDNLSIKNSGWDSNVDFSAAVVKKILEDGGFLSRNAVSALPTFSVFSSVLNLSNVEKKDIASAIHWEAKKVIPLPLDEMILDWKQITDIGKEKDKQKKEAKDNTRVLLTGAPRSLVKKFIEIFKRAQINLLSLETETFSLIRSLIGNDKSTIMIVEIGANTTDVSIIDNGIPMLNRSIDIGGNSITRALSAHLEISEEKAEQFKYDLGISALKSKDQDIPKMIIQSIAPIVNEIKYAINLFQSKNNKKTEKVILSGGSALLPNLSNYLAKVLDLKIIIGDPWARISYPVDLKPLLNEIGPSMAVAIGLALREIE